MNTIASLLFPKTATISQARRSWTVDIVPISKWVFYYTKENLNDFLYNKQFRVTGL